MALLLIQNKGEAPQEAYTLMGASLSRTSDSLLGEFGSGSKLAICTLLRAGKRVIVYCGKTRMEFKTKVVEISDDIESQQKQQVYVQFGGTSTRKQDLGWVVDMGERDWSCNIDMAVREFVANAIDHTIKRGDNVREAQFSRDLCVEIVPNGLRKAQRGYTRVYIGEACDDCQKYVDELPRRFLQFSNQPLNEIVMSKIDPARKKAQVYLCGAWVCELENSAESMFDYNFRKHDIHIDESRNLNEYVVRAAIATQMKDAPVDVLSKVFRALCDGKACLETGLDSYYIKPSYMGAKESQKEKWQQAWVQTHGENVVVCTCDSGPVATFAEKKGYTLAKVSESGWADAAKEYGIKSVSDVLDADERVGRTLTPPTQDACVACHTVLQWLRAGGVEGAEPSIKGFDEDESAESKVKGFSRCGEIGIRNDLEGDELMSEVLEQYVTHFADLSQDFRTLLLKVCVRHING